MDVLTVNCGSSSLRLDLLDPDTGERRASLRAEQIGADAGRLVRSGADPLPFRCGSHAEALERLLPELLERTGVPAAVAHRVVHGGARFSTRTRIDDAALGALEALSPLAPLHNPPAIEGIRAARRLLPEPPHVAVFDTAFHATLPRRARAYALPHALAEKHEIRRYGFHGIAHGRAARLAADHLGEDLRRLRLVTCHLGNGASVAAVEYGRSIETSMGMTPLEGLVMGTRSGDVDPGVLSMLMRRESLDAEALDELLNHESGLLGIAGVSDLREIERRAAAGDERSRLAIQVFAHRVRKYVGAYTAVMGGVDAIVFSGGIGENSALMRHRVAQRLEFLGARLDEDRNRDARVASDATVASIGEPRSRTRLLVVAVDEAVALAGEAAALLREDALDTTRRIPVSVSARHVHLSDDAVDALFGSGHRLEPEAKLSQPGQFAAKERVTLVGPTGRIEEVRVVGPARERCQVEIARTDEFELGLDAPVRRSGDLDHTPGITLEGPEGRLTLQEGVICAQRHIHMTPGDARDFGVADGDQTEVAVDTDGRDLVFGDVVVRVSPSYRLEMHVDTDEANAAGVEGRAKGVLAETDRCARLRGRS